MAWYFTDGQLVFREECLNVIQWAILGHAVGYFGNNINCTTGVLVLFDLFLSELFSIKINKEKIKLHTFQTKDKDIHLV